MKTCKNCGAQINDDSEFCSFCGTKCENFVKPETHHISGGEKFGWGALGFFIPLAGLILFLVWLNDVQNKEKGIASIVGGAISIGVSILTSVVIWVVPYIIMIIGMSAAAGAY